MAPVKGTESSAVALQNVETGSLNGTAIFRPTEVAANTPAVLRSKEPAVDSSAFLPNADRIPIKDVSYSKAKRVLDVSVALVGIVVLSWLFALVALLVRLTSRGPIIFKQTRVGRGGRRFTCYKFRSMRDGADQMRHQILHLNEVPGPVFKIKNDPRLTPIGGFLRKLSLDELPQLLNVLKGDMSIVGPRPPMPEEVMNYADWQLQRLSVQPGLTCYWQVYGRSNIPFDRWIKMDLEYIQRMSFWEDVKIILLTIPAVITGDGAH